MTDGFRDALVGGHPNSLGRTVEVVDCVLDDPARLGELLACYGDADPTVRLRTSNALKRIARAQPDLLVPHLDDLIDGVGTLDQASAQWTLAQLFGLYRDRMSDGQCGRAEAMMRRNLGTSEDWIVLTQTMATLADWARADADLAHWLIPQLRRLSNDPRRSVSGRAVKLAQALTPEMEPTSTGTP